MVAFRDIKKIIKENDDEDEVLPSKTMTNANLVPRGETKYLFAIAKSIEEGKTFAFKTKQGPVRGVIEKIVLSVGGKEIRSVEPAVWANWAEKTAKTESVSAVQKFTRFYVDGEPYSASQMYKTDAAVGGLRMNLGDVAEAILGSAITAKFEKGGREVNKDDVFRILKSVVEKGSITATSDYKEAEIQDDTITFTLSLNATSMKGLKSWLAEEDPMGVAKDMKVVADGLPDKTVKAAQKYVIDATTYANENKRANVAVNKAKQDPAKNTVEVISDGGDATQQNITKVDLKIKYDNKVTRLLSLKAGRVKQFGQVSGGTFENASNFFESTIKVRLPDEMKEKDGWKDADDPDHKLHNLNKGPFKKMYASMAKQVSEYTKGDDVNKEYNLIQILYDAINYHATRGEEGVTMVILSPSAKIAYKELAFDQRLLKALELYNLELINETGLAQHRISVVGTLKTDQAKKEIGPEGVKKIDGKAVLVQLSTRLSSNAVRNLVEMGDLLKDIASIEKLEAQEIERQAQEPQPEQPEQPQKTSNNPNAKVEETVMTPTQEFGPTFDIVDDLHIYMRNNKDAYRGDYYPMLCNMQKAIEGKEKISVKELMMPTIKKCGAQYNKEFNLASSIDDIMTMEQARELAKKIYDEEVPLMRKGVYK